MKGRKIKWKISLKGACKPLTYLRKWQSTQGSLWGTSTGKHIQSVLHHILLAQIHAQSTALFLSHGKSKCKTSKYEKKPTIDFCTHLHHTHTKDTYPACQECRMAKGILVPQKRFCMYKESQQIQNSRPGSTSIKTSPSRPTTSVRFQMATVPAFLSRTKALLFSPPVSKA